MPSDIVIVAYASASKLNKPSLHIDETSMPTALTNELTTLLLC